MDLEVGLSLSTRDKISYLEIVKMARSSTRCDSTSGTKTGGKLPLVNFSESGWFLIRAVTDVPETYRFATTAPYYVEIGDRPRISKSSAQFFLDWVNERIKKLEKENSAEFELVADTYLAARKYWGDLAARANVE